ncbi:MAG: DUF4340 domain-containing protein [Pseudomonadales bacterium]|jgi:hypothetical protein|nr:DUF4340 domain-containing protein [Pseudomonadales bacterium]
MTPMIRNLTLLLAAELVLVAALNLSGRSDAGHTGPLLAFEPDSVQRLRISDGDGRAVMLEREAEGWVLPEAERFPADADRIDDLLAELAGLEAGAPVARSTEAHERFRVTEDAFERHVVLEDADGTVGELLLGRSRDTRRVHARADDAEAVVVIELPTWELPTARRDWLDQSRLQLEAKDVVAIELEDLRIERDEEEDDDGGTTEDGWRLAAREADDDATRGEPDGAAVDRLVRRLATLRVADVLTDAPAAEDEATARTVVLETRDGRRVRYVLTPLGEDWALATSLRPERFRLDAVTAKPILEHATPGTLLAGGEEAPAEEVEQEA